jgi:hypothetical protein
MIFSDGRINAVSWATDRPGGFSEADLRLFEEILPTYSTIVEVKSLRRFATNVLSTYVGREPGELIMKGQIRRGEARAMGNQSRVNQMHSPVCSCAIRRIARDLQACNINQKFDMRKQLSPRLVSVCGRQIKSAATLYLSDQTKGYVMPMISGFSALADLPWERVTDKIERRVLAGQQGMIVWWKMKAGAHAAAHQHPHERSLGR